MANYNTGSQQIKGANKENLIDKDIFQLELRNRFNALYCEDQELDIESEWTAGRDIIKNTCEEVLEKTNKKKEWMSHTTWQKVEERRRMKEKVSNAKTSAQKNDAHTKHQNLDKEIINIWQE